MRQGQIRLWKTQELAGGSRILRFNMPGGLTLPYLCKPERWPDEASRQKAWPQKVVSFWPERPRGVGENRSDFLLARGIAFRLRVRYQP